MSKINEYIYENKVNFILIHEDGAVLSDVFNKDSNVILYNPFLYRTTKLPNDLSFGVTIGISINAKNHDEIILKLLDPDGIELKTHSFNIPKEKDEEFVSGISGTILSSSIEKEGEYIIQVLLGEEILGEQQVIILEDTEEDDER